MPLICNAIILSVLGLHLAAGVSAEEQEGIETPNSLPAATENHLNEGRGVQHEIRIQNIAEEKVDVHCLAEKVPGMRALIDQRALSPLKVLLFAGHPLVTGSEHAPHAVVSHNEREYLIPLAASRGSVRVISRQHIGETINYAGFDGPASFSVADCLK